MITLVETASERARVEAQRLEAADQKRRDAASLLKDLQLRHGSVDAISLKINDIEGALKDSAGIPAIVEQIKELEKRADILATEIETAAKGVEVAELNLEDAEKLCEQSHARDRGAALR